MTMITTTNKKTSGKRILSLVVCAIIACAALITAVFAIATANETVPQLDIYATNLSFSDSIYIKYAVTFENADPDNVKLLVFKSPRDNYEYENINVKDGDAVLSPIGTRTIEGKTCLIFDFTGLAAKDMTDFVYARAYYTSDGESYYSDVKKYSVLTYAYNKLGYTGTATTNEDLRALLEGLLEYGASAQLYKDYKTDTLATDTYVKVTLNNGGVFEDGCSTTLAKPGTELTVIAPTSTDKGGFLFWADEEGNLLSTNNTYVLTVGDVNTTLSAVYVTCKGGEIEGAGSTLAENSFALTEHSFDASVATEKTAASLQSLIKSGLGAKAVYRVSDEASVNVTTNVNGNGAVIIAPNGVVISGEGITVENLIIIGSVSVVDSSNVTLTSVEVQSTENAVTVDAESSSVTFNDCRIIADGIGIYSSASNTTVKSSYINASTGVSCNSDENTVYNCEIRANVTGVQVFGEDNAVNNNSITSSPHANGVAIGEDSLNSLVTYNKIVGSENAIKIVGATNTVVLFNSAYNVFAEGNTNTYVVENALGGQLKLTKNNYLLCDANTYSGENNHAPVMTDNDNINGDSLMDVTARNEVGAKEELLPHTNRDLFIDMERKDTVKDVANGTSYDLNTYIEENAKTNGVVIVPPGAYSTADGDIMTLEAAMSNTEIYAFGVYNEHGFLTDAEYLANTNKNNYVLRIVNNAENISLHGLTIAYDYQALGQAHVLDINTAAGLQTMTTKSDSNTTIYGYKVTIVPSPGFDLSAGWGASNADVFSKSFYACDPKGLSPWFSSSKYDVIGVNEDGTITLLVEQTVCEKLQVGSILCNRMAGDNQQTIGVSNAKNVLFKDMVIHGYAAALALVMGGESYDVKYERVHNCPTAPAIMTEEDYNFYASLEAKYPGASFEMYVDKPGRYRGSAPRFCSVDATHVTGSSEGLNIESCLFEQMCDDGSNQHGTSSRLYNIKDNGDGTATIFIKGAVHEVYHGIYTNSNDHDKELKPISFSKGDNIYIYNSKGELVCDTECLTDSKDESQLSELYLLGVMQYTVKVSSVKVPIESVNFAALEGYDLKDNHFSMSNKILVDNISHVSGHFTVDNYLIRNSWSRGVLTKTVDVTIKNSTIQNIKSAGVLVNSEPNWGESTVPRNITIQNCIIDGTGYTDETWDTPTNAPIYVSALSTYGEANIHKLRCENITITGCEIKNYGHQYAIYVNGAQNVKILNNVFAPMTQSAPGNFIDITTAANVEISGNKYKDASGNLSTISGVKADDCVNIHGNDVEGLFPHDCDIYIAGKHAGNFKIVPANKENIGTANILSSKLKAICGYSIASTVMPYTNEIKLVVSDSESNLIKSNTYTVECTDGQLVITAASNASLIYAVEHFADYIDGLNQQSISFAEGYSDTFTFSLTSISATDTNKLKYTGVWNTSGSAMVSGADADYVEFNFTGHSFTLLFNGETAFDISIDGENAIEYTVTGEMTFTLSEGEHTVRVLCTDDSELVSFLGIKTYSSVITKTANKSKYVMFIGDSMVDYDQSFAHRVGDVLGWDYSVVVGNTLPSSITRTPDVFVLFLGTDAITSSSTSDEIKAFKTTYQSLITSITNKYSSAMVYIMQPLSSSDASNMFNTSHNRYAAINAMKDYSLTGTLDNYKIALNSNVQIIEKTNKLTDWGIEFDTATSTTAPTANGDYTVTVKLAQYLLNNVGDSDYINVTFPLNSMTIYKADTISTITQGMVEDGVTFNRYSFGLGGHAWLNGGADYATAEAAVAGRYLVLKYRASGEANLTLELRTNDYGTDLPDYGNGYLSKITKTENNVPEEWEIAIVDLTQFAHYTVGLTNTKIQLRMSTESDEFDIAYAVIVDDLSEAKMAAMFELGATQYRFYDDWSKPGVDVSLDGQEIEGPIDLSFVNQEFSILGMGKYNGAMSLHVNTEEGINFQRFHFGTDINASSPTGHVFLLGVNEFVEISGDTGRYFIMKYRSTNDYSISFNALTSDYPHSSTGSHMATQIKPAANIKAGVWETAVIDMSTFIGSNGKYTTDEDLQVWLRLTTRVDQIDIAYMAIVDDLDEANTFVKYKGDSTFVHYTDWSKTGETVTVK